jgi:hypothetical protein
MMAETEGKPSTLEPLARAILKGAREMVRELAMSDATRPTSTPTWRPCLAFLAPLSTGRLCPCHPAGGERKSLLSRTRRSCRLQLAQSHEPRRG